MLAHQFSVEHQCKTVCFLLSDSPLWKGYFARFVEKAPLVMQPFRQRALLLNLLLSLLRFPFRPPSVYVPHISPNFFSFPGHLGLLMRLDRLGFVRFYDDGISAISGHTHVWERQYVTCSRADLISWDYRFLRSAKPSCNRLSSLAAYRVFASLHQARISEGIAASAPPEKGEPSQSFVLASKWINWASVIAMMGEGEHHASSVTYLPHFMPHKNNQYLLHAARKWSYDLPPELVLPAILNRFDMFFFGVTSTVPFVIEVMVSMGLPITPLFVLALDPALVDRPGEAEDFTNMLRFYQSQHGLRFQVASALPSD